MKLLLDTHIWIWSLLEPRRLSRVVATELQNTGNELWLSPVSVWELVVLCRKGRITLDRDVKDWVGVAMESAPMREAPLTAEVALATEFIDLPHKDPADRFLAATAKVFDLRLVTADKRLVKCSDISVLS